MEKIKTSSKGNFFLILVGTFIFFGALVLAVTPNWGTSSSYNYSTSESSSYIHDFSINISGFNNDVNFTIDTESTIYWTNSEGRSSVSQSTISPWILITDRSQGLMEFNATYDNQTGFFEIPIQATNTTDDDSAGTVFEFIINATNDAPNFTQIDDVYSMAQNSNFLEYLNGSDEEEHYPLNFTVTFNGTCTHSELSGLNDNENCSLYEFGFNLTNVSNTAASMNFTPTTQHVGVYWANVSVVEASHSCPHDFCLASEYEPVLTTTYSQMVQFNVNSALSIDASNCTNATLMEGVEFNCTINITTTNETDSLDLSSYAFFRKVPARTYYSDNRDWFYADSTNDSSNFFLSVPVSLNLSKKEVGNWTINFTADDSYMPVTEQIYLFVNYTEEAVSLDTISDQEAYENISFNVTAYDGDLLIRDSDVKFENLTFASNTSWVEVTKQEYSLTSGLNYSKALVEVDYDSVVGLGDENYSILINVTDTAGNTDEQIFTIEIYNNSAPEWNDTTDYIFSSNEDEEVYINLSEYATDEDGDSLIFYYVNHTKFDNFNLTEAGIINFTPSDIDVGYHNVTMYVSDGKVNTTHTFNFTIFNVVDTPYFGLVLAVSATEDTEKTATLTVYDDDFLIPSSQRDDFYNETLTIELDFDNLTVVTEAISYSYDLDYYDSNQAEYVAVFTPTGNNVGTYNVTVNVTDYGGSNNYTDYTLTITSSDDSPILDSIENYSKTIYETFYLDVNATDEEDSPTLPENGVLNYTLENLTVGGNFMTINLTTGIINASLNSSVEGSWHYNLSVNDSTGNIDSQEFWLYVYGNASLVSPSEDSLFELNESEAETLNFTFNHSVGDNLTYEFWIDDLDCDYNDSSSCNYSNLSFREAVSNLGNGTLFGWSFTPNYTDETYGNLKNLTVSVYPNSTELNSTQRESLRNNFSFSLNISHKNYPPTIYSGFGSHSSTTGSSTPINLSLEDYVLDYDYLDSYYLQQVNFSLTSNLTTSKVSAETYGLDYLIPWSGPISDWSLQLYGMETTVEKLTLVANDSINSDTSDPFTVTFTTPDQTVVPAGGGGGGGGGSSKLKYYSLKIISPQDVIIDDLESIISVPFSVKNEGQTDLSGINLSSVVMFDNQFTDDVKISIGDAYIPTLKIGQSENFTMTISANTQRSGKYKATIYGNVTSPKFSDWGDFYIELRRINESEAEQILLFTEKMIAENPECLELTENLKIAQDTYLEGDLQQAAILAQAVIESCEDSIIANEQVRFPLSGFVEKNLFYITSVTLGIFLLGFIIYIYKRARFNKSRIDDYV